MKIFHCNTLGSGGAATAASRLQTALCAEGVESCMGTMQCSQGAKRQCCLIGNWQRRFSLLALRAENVFFRLLGTKFNHIFSTGLFPSSVHNRINAKNADIVHLHWVQENFVPLWSLTRIDRPIVMTLHDTWGFTGGCHILQGCDQYATGCAACPRVSPHAQWIVRQGINIKRRAYDSAQINVVIPSRAYLYMARQSTLLRQCKLHHIPNSIDTVSYAPLEQEWAQQIMNLTPRMPTLLFGAMAATADFNKGYDLLYQALHHLPQYTTQSPQLLVFGASDGVKSISGYPVHYLGRLHDDVALRAAYCAADVFVCPSREDNLPNTVMESLACGTPVAAFAVGGIPEMVEDKVNGCLATPQDPDALARAIAYILEDVERRTQMRHAARRVVEERYAMPVVAKQYINLYEEILSVSPRNRT